MKRDFGEIWLERAAAEVIDRRLDHWDWDAERRLLRVRPGRAAELAEQVLAEPGGEGIRLESLERRSAGRVKVCRTSLRLAPGHGAEQVGQLRLGQPFEIWAEDGAGDWLLGRGPDRYPAWLRSWHLERDEEDSVPDIPADSHVVTVRQAVALAAPAAGGRILHDLSFATRLPALGSPEGAYLPWRLPGGGQAWTPLADLSPLPEAPDGKAPLSDWARLLLGAPYEWGGTTSWGCDCSGFVQALFSAAGLMLPRDSDLQAKAGKTRPADRSDDWQRGDLLFFGREKIEHVAMLIDEGRVIHAQAYVREDMLGQTKSLRGLPLRIVQYVL